MNKLLWLLLIYAPLCVFAERIPMTLKHAVTQEQLASGLMGCKALPPDEGMTFNFSFPQPVTIWMYNCYIDLSRAFLDGNKVIREIHEMKAFPQMRDKEFFQHLSVTSSFPAAYVLEMNAGWFAKHGIQPGAKAFWTLDSTEGWVESNACMQ